MVEFRRPSPYWTLAAIVAVGAALRLYQLDAQSLWHDEAISVVVSRAPLDRTLDFFRAAPSRLPFEYNPPLYGFLLHAWFALFGVGGYQARLLSAVAGILVIPVTFWLAARLFGVSAGLFAALLLAVSQLGVMFSQEARNYELFMLLAVSTASAYWNAMSHRSVRAWCVCAALAVLMVFTNYYGVFVILALAIDTAIYWRSIPLSWLAGAAVLGIGTVVPWLRFAFGAQLSAASDRVQPEYFAVGPATIAGTVTRFNNGAVDGVLQSTPLWTHAVGALLFGGPLLFLFASARRSPSPDPRDRRAIVFALLLWLAPLVSVLGLGFMLNVQYNIRYVAFCIAPYYMLVGAGLARLPGGLWRSLAVAAIAVFSAYALTANFRVPYKENYRDAIAFVSSQAEAGDCHAFVPFGGPPLEWSIYAPASVRPDRLVKLDADSAVPACDRLWVITYQRVTNDPHRWRERIATVSRELTKRAERQFFWIKVELYAR